MYLLVHSVDRFLPNRLTEPDLKTIDVETAPTSSEKVPPLVNDNHDVEHHDDKKNDADEAEGRNKEFHIEAV